VVQDGTADVGPGEGFEGRSLFGLEPLGSPNQADQAHLEEILHAFSTTAAVMNGDGPHQILMGFNEAIALLQGKAAPQAAIGGGNSQNQ
jgi:hypothetical protein